LHSGRAADTLSPNFNPEIMNKNLINGFPSGSSSRRPVMAPEETLGQILAERRWPDAALALVADIDVSTATRIVKGECRPRGTTAVRIAEGLGIGYGRMRRILAATWEAGQAAQAAQESSAGSAAG
jgi:hypothetical protein